MGLLEMMDFESTGIVPTSLRYIFDNLKTNEAFEGASISISMVQIYKQDLMDLLNSNGTKACIREDPVSYSRSNPLIGNQNFLHPQISDN